MRILNYCSSRTLYKLRHSKFEDIEDSIESYNEVSKAFFNTLYNTQFRAVLRENVIITSVIVKGCSYHLFGEGLLELKSGFTYLNIYHL